MQERFTLEYSSERKLLLLRCIYQYARIVLIKSNLARDLPLMNQFVILNYFNSSHYQTTLAMKHKCSKKIDILIKHGRTESYTKKNFTFEIVSYNLELK